MEKGQKIKLTIEDVTAEGQGVGRSDEGAAIFVGGALPGDKVTVELTKVKKKYAFGRVLFMDEPSEDRTDGFCTYEDCGGCPYGNLTYEKQLTIKRKHVVDALTRLGSVKNPVVNDIIGMDEPYYYRNKASMPVSTGGIITRKGGVVENLGVPSVGFYQAKSHKVVDCQACGLQSPAAMAAAEALRRFMDEDNITGYDPKWEKGLMRHMVVRTAFGTGEVMVILVINGKGVPNAAKLVEYMDDAIASISEEEDSRFSLESVYLNVHKDKSSEIFGEKMELLTGKRTIEEHIGNMRFEISPMSFYQVNPWQMEKLYDRAAAYANLSGGETILDLYCGAGTIGLWLLDDLRQRNKLSEDTALIGIESVRSAVLDANRNAVINNMVSPRFICGRAEEELPKLLDKHYSEENGETAEDIAEKGGIHIDSVDVVILDPPRAGCDAGLLQAVADAAPERIVYVSCDPATLARDIKLLGDMDYEFVEATPVDMFPWTGHVETVVLMSRVDK